MSGEVVVFTIVSAMVLFGALGVVSTKNVGHAALYLLITLISVAGIFILLLAEFLALVQILIYGGAITIVLFFGLMLTRIDEFSSIKDTVQRPVAIAISFLLLSAIATPFLQETLTEKSLVESSLRTLGHELFTQWLIPFEVASLVLLVALIGAIVVGKDD
jgi:NADH-quinone oxidoreductase subunit J